MMRTANPTLNDRTFRQIEPVYAIGAERMTLDGVVNRTGMLLLLAVAGALYPWSLATSGQDVSLYLWGGLIGGLVLALVTSFKPAWAGFTAPA